MNNKRIAAKALLVCPLLAGPTLAAEINCSWIAGDGSWNNASKWGCGKVPNNGSDSFNVFIDDDTDIDSLVQLNISPVINKLDVAAGDELFFLNDADLTLTVGPITNNGVISMNTTGNGTDLRLAASLSLAGSGELFMGGGTNNVIRNNFGGVLRLTNGASHTIRGTGQIGINSLYFTNEGLVDADQTTVLQIDLHDGESNFNTGTLQASAGGQLNILNCSIDNTDGLIQALAGSKVFFSGAGILGGEFHTEGDGELHPSTSVPGFQDFLLTGLLLHSNDEDAAYVGTITNEGTIRLAAEGNSTEMRLHSEVTTFAGSGAIEMLGTTNNVIRNNYSAVRRLLNGAEHTIRGTGQIGVNSLYLTNEGLVDADQAAVLQIDLQDGESNFNTGTLQASAGSQLNILNCSINNTDGLIQALAGSRIYLIGAGIVGGELHTEGDGVIHPHTNVPSLQDISLTGLLLHSNDEDAAYVGTITNEGTIRLEAEGNSTEMRLHSEVTTFAGSGAIEMLGTTNNVIRNNYSAVRRLLNGAEHTIRGTGQIGGNTLYLTNDGLVDANQAAVLQIDLRDDESNLNRGVLQASAGSQLNIFNSTLDNTDGLIQALADSSVNLIGSGIVGGTLHTEDDGAFFASTSPPFLQDITLSGLLRHTNDQDSAYNATITNNGTISLESTGNNTEIRVHSNGTTFAGTGEIAMGNQFQNIIRNNYSSVTQLTNGAEHTIRGSGQLGGNTINLINEGLIDADQEERIQIDLNDTFEKNLNPGIMQASNGGRLDIVNTPLDNSNGVIQALAKSSVNLIGSTIVGGTLNTEDDGAFFASTSPPFLQDLSLTGLLRHANDQDAAYAGTITNNGTIRLEAAGNLTEIRIHSAVTTMEGSGVIEMQGSTNNIIRNNYSAVNEFVNGADHTIRGNGQIGVNTLYLTNEGAIISDLSGGINIDGRDDKSGFTNNGTLAALGSGGVTIHPGNVTNNGVFLIAPGSQIFRSSSAFTQPDTGTIHIQIAGTNTGDAGQFKVSQMLTRNGIVSAEAVNGYLPEVADEVLVFTVGSFSGDFDLFTTTNFPEGLTIRPLYVGNQGFIVVVRLGDMNCDGAVDFDDIDGFVQALISPAEYKAAYPDCTIANGDINGDGSVDFDDIDAFVACLIAGGCS